MSVEAVKQFYAALGRDKALRQKLADLFLQHQALDAIVAARLVEQKILPLAAEQGFLFSLADMRRYEEDLWRNGKELNDAELQSVTGGYSDFYSIVPCQGLFQQLFGALP